MKTQSSAPLCFTVFNDYLGFALTLTIFAPLILSNHFIGEMAFKERSFILGLLLASYPLMQFFSAPFIGGLSDRYGRKPLLMVTIFISMLCYVLGGLAIINHSLVLLFMARIFGGVVAGNVTAAQAAIADMSNFDNKTRNMAYLTSAVGIGFIAGAVVGGKLTEYGFATPFWFVASLFFLNFLQVLIFFKETRVIQLSMTSFRLTEHISRTVKTIRLIELRPYFMIFFLSAIAINFFIQFGGAFLKVKFFLGAPQIGDYYGLIIMGFLLSTLFLIRFFSKHFDIKNLATITLLGMAFLVATIALLGSPIWLYLPFFLYGIGNGLFNASIYPMVSNAAEKEDQGKAFGVLVSINSFAQVFAPAVSGLLFAYHPDIPLLFGSLIFFITGIISLCTFSFILRGHKS